MPASGPPVNSVFSEQVRIERRRADVKRTVRPMQIADAEVAAVCSFPPIANRAARVLVLGSMPGAASLLANRYYAHPHNAFWPIMGELFGAGPALAYEKRMLRLKRAGLALWDVMASCVREGSLDSAIDEASIVPNDFAGFFDAHPGVTHVFFNGAKAENCFSRYVRPHLAQRGLTFTRLPSTSPAHASLSLQKKIRAWRAVAEALEK
jgi:double-stranded uracil-DNA glycosylase